MAGQAPWHAETTDAAFKRCGSSKDGLTSAEAADRLRANGPNKLPEGKRKSGLARLFAQFNNLLIYVLIASAAIALGLGHPVDAGVILGVVLINAAIGFVQEGRAEKALDAIRGMLAPRASVLRDGRRLTVPVEELVAGDVAIIEAGDRVPADLRLIRASGLKIEEAALTGESVPADKGTAPVAMDAPLGDRSCMAYTGTLVAGGQGAGVVVATGAGTELGRISAMVGEVQTLTTPLLRQMNEFGRRLTIVILAIAAAVFAVAVAFRGYDFEHALLAAVGMAVAAIPEGLPAVMSITLAIGVRRMAERNAIIRRLPAVETLGAVSTIGSDKTGTLTLNEMTASAAVTAAHEFEASGSGYEPRGALRLEGRDIAPADFPPLAELARAAFLCNDASLRQAGGGWIVDGDPMEGALIAFAIKAGATDLVRSDFVRIAEIPFDSRHRFMATLHERRGEKVIYVKGAPERVLDLCDRQRTPAGDAPLDAGLWRKSIEELAARGQRVLAFAVKQAPARDAHLDFADIECGGLTLLGLVGLIDPPRPEAVAAVAECQSAGIAVKMITGDHAATAAAIARQLGLGGEAGGEAVGVLTGQDLDRMDDAALAAALPATSVFARASPEHKLRLVEALQADGAIVAMTGDGVNDAPALKRADVGVAMGHKGTEAAKEAAQMVLADDNFATIAAAVREGRIVYDNLIKAIAWSLPTNGGEAMTIVAAILIGVTLPMAPVQILWVNMVTAVTLGLVFAFDPAEQSVMSRAPRDPRAPILSRLLVWRTAFVSLLFCLAVFAIFFWAGNRGEELEHARTLAVNAMVALEIAYLFSIRLQHDAPFDFAAMRLTRPLVIAVGVVVALQAAFNHAPPLQYVFETRPIGVSDALVIVIGALGLVVILEIEKAIRQAV